MIPSWAKMGAKVVCVEDTLISSPPAGVEWTGGLDGLRKGHTYTIRCVFFDDCLGEVCVRLKEITRPPDDFPYEGGYNLFRFRPLITEADDIALFKSLLNPTLVDKLDLLAERLDHIYNE